MFILIFALYSLSFTHVIGSSHNCTGTSTLITFDDLPTITVSTLISNGYFGLSWSNAYYDAASRNVPGSGYYTALSSGSYITLNGFGNPMAIASTTPNTFNISSFIAAAAWNDNLNLAISGKRNGTTVYQQTVTLQVTNSTWVSLNWTYIDTVTFTTSGGTVNSLFAGTYSGSQFAMDDLCVDINSFYTSTTSVYGTSTTRSGSGGGGNGDGDGGDGGDGLDLELELELGKKPKATITIGGLPVAVFAGTMAAVVVALIIFAFLLWCFISSKCCTQKPHCRGCGGGGC
ncbi:unnamed protein product [Adineta ricciae]|uniref:Uncharacterized protein n=1 Tax=Adineta ricciae TaxID=249248 RepID=A0A815LGY2_ADIRI|nr:unnamed protein product [Adineta ricciae]CAF1408117.1 unnamed protein product [Adineta ricciae]